MKTSEMIQSKFLKKEDFDDPKVFTIKGCSLEEVGKDGDNRWVLFFRESDKGMVLNVTKIRLLEASYGPESDDWIGKRVKLSHDPNVTFAGKIVGGIRMDLPKKTDKAPAPKAAPKSEHDEFDDPLPF